MPLANKNDPQSPFSKSGLNSDKQRAFTVVAVLAAASFLCMMYGIYVDFIRQPPVSTVFWLSRTHEATPDKSLVNPQPPEKQKAATTQAPTDAAALIERLEREKKTIDQTAQELSKIIDGEVPARPESDAVQALQNERDKAAQEKADEIKRLEKEREEQQQRKLDNLENALNAFVGGEPLPEQTATEPEVQAADDKPTVPAPTVSAPVEEKPAVQPKLATQSALRLVAPGERQSVADFAGDLPEPDLATDGLMASLPDFGSIKKNTPPAVLPLAVIDPIPALQEDSLYGKLPVKKDGKTPFETYAKPVDLPPQRPFVAILFSGLGKRLNATEAALNSLPDTVSLSFSPYTEKLAHYITESRRLGHEALIDLPMQQGAFPETDPGPLGLVSGLPERENRKRLMKILANNSAYIGLSAATNEQFSFTGTQMKPFFEEINRRGLAYIDGTDNSRLPKFKDAVRPDIMIADNFYRAAIRARLEQARQLALSTGSAFVRVETRPITLVAVEEWMKTFVPTEQDPVPEIVFVPLSYYIQKKAETK